MPPRHAAIGLLPVASEHGAGEVKCPVLSKEDIQRRGGPRFVLLTLFKFEEEHPSPLFETA